MDVTTIRARNIAMLVEQHGGPTAFGREIERDQVQVSQWTSHLKPKPIGGRLARYIEAKIGRDHGWLDRPHWIAEEPAEYGQSQPLKLDPEIVRRAGRALNLRYKKAGGYNLEDRPEEFVRAYELWLGMDDAYENPEVYNLVILHADLSPQGANDERGSEGAPTHGAPGEGVRAGRRR